MQHTPLDTPARRAAVRIVERLRDAGHLAYFAGGCVRDELLKLTPKDYDVATDAEPKRVRELFKHSRYVGEAFGVVLVRMREEEIDPDTGRKRIEQVEVATFRAESGYEDGRRPSEVAFTDAENDAQRRDFTINGLFEDPLADHDEQRIIDYVGGVDDLKQGVLRAIGDPAERFGEDYLRMLRAVRFAARFRFELEEKTAVAIRHHAPKLAGISRERIGAEVLAMLAGPRPATALTLMESLGLDGPVLNESAKSHALRTVHRLAETAATPSTETWLCAWLLDRHVFAGDNEGDKKGTELFLQGSTENNTVGTDPFGSARWREALCLPNDLRDAMRDLLVALPAALRWPELSVATRKRLLARSCWEQLTIFLRALTWRPTLAELVTTIESESAPLFEQGVAPPRLLTGDDLIALGVEPGPRFGALLEAVYDEQLEGRVTTRDGAAAWLQTQV